MKSYEINLLSLHCGAPLYTGEVLRLGDGPISVIHFIATILNTVLATQSVKFLQIYKESQSLQTSYT